METTNYTHEAYDNVKNELIPRATLIYKFLDKKARIRTSYGEAFKEPANWQRFIDQPTGMGTPEMVPERSKTYEISLGYDPTSNISLRLDAFKMNITNIIWENFDPTVADPAYFKYGIFGKFHPQQTGRDADMNGFEFSIQSNITPFLAGYFNYSYIDSKDTDGKPLDYESKHKFNVGVRAKYNQIATFSVGTHYVGKTIDRTLEYAPIDPNDLSKGVIGIRDVDPYILTEAKLSLNIFKGATLSISGWNIGGKVHEQQLGCPVPGETFGIEVSYPF